MGVIVGCSYNLQHQPLHLHHHHVSAADAYPPPSAECLLPAQYAAPAPAYKAVEKPLPPQPYTYQYGVADDYSKANFQKAESQDEGGNVQGEYTADPLNGYIADVTYEG